ncbi:hypothetical protein [Nonomuraea sp. B1E8]|uniref:hypothetical protein n=1 Tax=unclassified Nonomuraea TaxID=2593643 RepID=UPI00325E7372
MDPPQHSFYRRMLIQEFTLKRIKTMRRPVADRVVFDKLIQVLVVGCGYRKITDATRSTANEPPCRRTVNGTSRLEAGS